MLISEQIAIYLSILELGIYSPDGTDGNIYIDQLPPGKQYISIYNRGGIPGDDKLGYTIPGIQIIYRGDSNPISSSKVAQDIYECLIGIHDRKIYDDGNHIVSFLSENGGPTCLGTNEEGNFEYSTNFRVEYKR